MYSLTLDASPRIPVQGGKHSVAYATDGSLMNPLEAFYAALAGCAGPTKRSCTWESRCGWPVARTTR